MIINRSFSFTLLARIQAMSCQLVFEGALRRLQIYLLYSGITQYLENKSTSENGKNVGRLFIKIIRQSRCGYLQKRR